MKNLGKHVIVRSNGVGVLFGVLTEKNGQELALENVRKIYRWKGANTVEDLAIKGVGNKADCKITIEVPSMVISEYLQILPCTDEAIKNLKSVSVWSY